MKLLRTLGLRRDRIGSCEAFGQFLAGQAAFVTQKFAYGYCRARVGRAREQIMFDALFTETMEVCRWDGFAAMAGDMVIWAEQHLRREAEAATRVLGLPVEGGVDALHAALRAIHDGVLDGQPLPVHRTGWEAEKAALAARLAEQRHAPEAGMLTVFDPSWTVLFDRLPITDHYKLNDKELVYGTFRLWLIHYVEAFDKTIDVPGLARALVNAGHAGAPSRAA